MRILGGFEKLPTLDLMREGDGTTTKIKLMGIRKFQSQYNSGMATAYEVEYGGEKMQFFGSTVLDRILAEAPVGSELTIQYLGKQASPDKGKQPFKNFRAFVNDPAYDGDDMAESATPAAKKKVPF